MWKPIYQPEPWLIFLKRKENVGVPIMEVRKRYLKEQLLFENYVSSLQTLNTMNTSNPSSGAGGGPQPIAPDPGKKTRIDLCRFQNDRWSTLFKVEGGDQYINQTYYVDGWNSSKYEQIFFDTFGQDAFNAWDSGYYIWVWDGSDWNFYYYMDVAAGIFTSGVSYTDVFGNAVTSYGPNETRVSGDPDQDKGPIGEWSNGTITEGVCDIPPYKFGDYHLIPTEESPRVNPEAEPQVLSYMDSFATSGTSRRGAWYATTGSYGIESGSESMNQFMVDGVLYESITTGSWAMFDITDSLASVTQFDVVANAYRIMKDEWPTPLSEYSNPEGEYFIYRNLGSPGPLTKWSEFPSIIVENGEIPSNRQYYTVQYDAGKGPVNFEAFYVGKTTEGYLKYGQRENWGSIVFYWSPSDGAWKGENNAGNTGLGSTNINDASGTITISDVFGNPTTYTITLIP